LAAALDSYLSLAHVERYQRLLPDFLSWDKAEHALMYFGLSMLAAFGAATTRSWLMLLVVSELLGILFEFLQSLTGYRSFDVQDMLANSVGVSAGLVVGWMWRRWRAGRVRPMAEIALETTDSTRR
jgi:VanZ family protein